ncbi:hypothetical protein DD237_006698 [Peronospora effusa]|uniref:RWP-RK domain-containing protein n=1 Tax=Peronospora effusa TaxID=542832 RepID=A0A3R7XWW1_9STRA|nr:hypothetical protein DD237_006693 [Peronospora effusa]RQM15863.1 hypothetical protein DD237_006698 [Peronospora effusa]
MNNNFIGPSTFLTSSPISTLTKVNTSRKRSSPSIHSTDKKKSRKSRRIHDFPPETLAPYYHMPQSQAAKALNVAVITIKRNCKRYGFRWPYRANKYKAGKKFVLSEKGRAFHELPFECLKQEPQFEPLTKTSEESTSECDTDTESIDNGEQVKKDYCKIQNLLHKTPIDSDIVGKTMIQV